MIKPDWERVETIVATLADATVFSQRLGEFRVAFENAERAKAEAAKLVEKVASADKLMAQASAQLVKNQEYAAELKQREANLVPAEKALAARETCSRRPRE